MKYAIYGIGFAVAVCLIPVFWGQASVNIAVWAFKNGLVRAEFAPGFGQLLTVLPWLAVSFAAFGFVIQRALRDHQ